MSEETKPMLVDQLKPGAEFTEIELPEEYLEETHVISLMADLAKKEGMAGATVLKGCMGFGCKSHMHTAKLLRLSEDLPIIIEIVDSRGVEKILPTFETLYSRYCSRFLNKKK